MQFELNPHAHQELEEAAAYYRERSGLEISLALLDDYARALGLLDEHPELGARWEGAYRRLLLRRFPYAIIYTVSGNTIRILAVAHTARRPGYWRERR